MMVNQRQETVISELEDYKKVAEKELKKKQMSIQNAET